MDRRGFLKCLGAGAVTASGLATRFSRAAELAAAGKRRPNVLVHMADDLSWAHLGCAGDPAVKTPNIDRVAAGGVQFTHAFVSSTTCTPSRAAVMTGRHFWELGDGANLKGTMPASFAVYTSLLAAAGYHVGAFRKGYGPGKAAGWSEWDNDPAGPGFTNFDAFLKCKPKDKPFVFWYGSTDPHRPYARGSGAKAGIPLDKLNLPPYWPDVPQVRGDVADYLFEVQRFDSDLGKLLRALESCGELDNTVILVLGDNGMPFPRCKASLYDYGTRCPMIVSWPGTIKGGRAVHDLVSYIDVAPTILELAGLEVPPEMRGKSLLSILNSGKAGLVDDSRSEVYFGTEGFARQRLWPVRGIRTREHLYIRNFEPDRWPVLGTLQGGPTKAFMDAHKREPAVAKLNALCFGKRPAEELYDVVKDRYQLSDLAGDPALAAVRKTLAERLENEMRKTKDPRLAGRQPGR